MHCCACEQTAKALNLHIPRTYAVCEPTAKALNTDLEHRLVDVKNLGLDYRLVCQLLRVAGAYVCGGARKKRGKRNLKSQLREWERVCACVKYTVNAGIVNLTPPTPHVLALIVLCARDCSTHPPQSRRRERRRCWRRWRTGRVRREPPGPGNSSHEPSCCCRCPVLGCPGRCEWGA
jgi:hypothetical protein